MEQDVKMHNFSANNLTIKEEYCETINYSTHIYKVNNSSIRVLIINNCPALSNAYTLIKHSRFVDFLYSLPHAFVLILKCHEMTGNFSDDFSTKYKRRRPMIISFESQKYKLVFFKNYGDYQKFQDVERMNIYSNHGFNFAKFLNKLNGGKFGYYSNHLLEMTIKNERSLINKAAESFDLLTIRFLHLFDRDLKPKYELINRIIKKDFESTTLDGFLTIFDPNFLYLNSDDEFPPDYQNLIYLNHNDMNFLMLSVKCRKKSAVKFFLRYGVNFDYLDREKKTAADYAYENKDYDILAELIFANSTYPHDFNPKECTNFKELLKDTTELHKLVNDAVNIEVNQDGMDIESNDTQEIEAINYIDKIKEIRQKYPNLRHFYDIANKSIATKAALKKNFEIYRNLLSENIFIGPFEELKSIKNHLSDDQVEEMRLIHSEFAINVIECHLSVLLSNSTVSHDNISTDYFKHVLEAFEFLNDIETIKPILKICAAQRDFKIIFDFNRESVEYIDPGTNKNTYGIFHLRGCHIYIGAKQLLLDDEQQKILAIASLAHELTHFAMLLTYDNNCNPYSKQDTMTEGVMKLTISDYKMRGNAIDPIVKTVFTNYQDKDHAAEFIVRAPHMTVLYYQDEEKFRIIKDTHSELFNFYNKILGDVEKKKVIVGQRYDEDLARAHGIWERKRRSKKFIRYGLIGSIVLGICFAVAGIFFDPCINNLKKNCSWNDLSWWTQRQIRNNYVTHQGIEVKFSNVFEGNSEALNSIPINMLKSPETIKINENSHKIPNPFFERQFLNSTAKLWTTESENDYDDVYRDNKYDFNSLRKMMLASNKLMIIAGEPLDGRTSVMRKINCDLRNSTNWVTLIEMKSVNVTDYDDVKSEENLIKFIKSAAELSPFESEIFQTKLANGDAILIIDGIDSIYPHHENFTNNLLSSLELNFKNKIEMWITTRDSFKSNVERIFNARSYKLLPLDKNTRETFFKLKLNQTNSSLNITKVRKFIESVEIWRDNSEHQIFNIYLLNALIDKKLTLSNVTLYEIVGNYTRRILGDELQSEIDGRGFILQKISMEMTRRKFKDTFKNIDMKILIATMNPRELKFTDNWNVNDDRIYNEIKFGILINGTDLMFIHKLIFEFYITKFIKEQIIEYGQMEIVSDNYINFLFNVAYDVDNEFELVRIMIEELMNENKQKFSDKFRKSFKNQLKKFYESQFNSTLEKYPDYSDDEKVYIHDDLKKIFKSDAKMLNIIKDHQKFIEDLVL